MNIYQKAFEAHLNFIKERQAYMNTEYGIMSTNMLRCDTGEKLRIDVISTVKDSKELDYIEIHTNLLISDGSLSLFDEYQEGKSQLWHVISPSSMNFYKEFEELLNE